MYRHRFFGSTDPLRIDFLLWAADFLALAAAYASALWLRFGSAWGSRLFVNMNRWLGVGHPGALDERFEIFYITAAPRLFLYVGVTVWFFYAFRNLYPGHRFLKPRPVAWHILVANAAALAVFYAYWYLSRNVFHPRSFFLALIVFNTAYGMALRAALHGGLQWLRRTRRIKGRAALLVGAGAEADDIGDLIQGRHPHGLHVVARYRPEAAPPFEHTLRDIRQRAVEHGVDTLILAEKNKTTGDIMRFLEIAAAMDLSAHVLSDKLDALTRRAGIEADMFYNASLVYFEAPNFSLRFNRPLHLLSRGACLLGLLVLTPVLLLVALCIRLTSSGPALFRQERIGVNRKPFTILKFRTMFAGSESDQADMEHLNESQGALFKIRQDPRVTPVGRVLRRFSLDELPQLVNVVRGEMALVGPRPLPRRDFENYYEDWHYGRHAGLPGITCLWQISGRSLVHFEDMCILDIYYLRNRDWIQDVAILLRTAQAVFLSRGAY